MKLKKEIIVAIDGHSSCGKSSYAKEIAKVFNYAYIDTGAMYRSVTFYALQNGMFDDDKLDAKELIKKLSDIDIAFKYNPRTKQNTTFLNDKNIESEIRGLEVANHVSEISAIKEVRKFLVKLQQNMGKRKRLVMDGRDIGTVVFPKAEIKIFLTAKAEIRAQRRYDELSAKGQKVNFDDILKNVIERDKIDQSRKESPLTQAEDALFLDNSEMTIKDQMAWFKDQLKAKKLLAK